MSSRGEWLVVAGKGARRLPWPLPKKYEWMSTPAFNNCKTFVKSNVYLVIRSVVFYYTHDYKDKDPLFQPSLVDQGN